MFVLTAACPSQAQDCFALIEEGRRFQLEQGFVQWTEGYPQLTHIQADIEAGKGYVLTNEEGVIAGYICIDFAGEPAYETIKGEWSLDEPCGVLHRMVVSSRFRGCGLGARMLAECERVCLQRNIPYIRADTSVENTRMQHVFEKNGFVRCGFVTLRGADKIAYDKVLSSTPP